MEWGGEGGPAPGVPGLPNSRASTRRALTAVQPKQWPRGWQLLAGQTRQSWVLSCQGWVSAEDPATCSPLGRVHTKAFVSSVLSSVAGAGAAGNGDIQVPPRSTGASE